MKNWTIDEFIAECTDLRKNQYTYDYSRMPEGICNGHNVRPYTSSWASIVLDDRIVNLAHGLIISNGEKMTPIEFVRRLLEAPIHGVEIGGLAVMFSIRPNWSRKIATREKIVEVRKTAPKIPTPYKGYLYCTLSGCNEFIRDDLHGDVAVWNRENWGLRKGHVWAEFICDKDTPLLFSCSDPAALVTHWEVPGTCLSDVEIMDYLGNGKQGHGLHISELTIYDKPREIGEFMRPCQRVACVECEYGYRGGTVCDAYLKRPPQSWCYVESSGMKSSS